jgi:nucleotide-binding universal stress UspA family protein
MTQVFQRIVVGVDGLDGGRDALALADGIQRACGGEVIAVYAYPYDRTVPIEGAEALEAALSKELQDTFEREVAKTGVAARSVIVEDASAARALHAFAEAEEADLIVVGAPSRGRGDRLSGGDVCIGTLDAAPCAVGVAPAGYSHRGATLKTIGAGFDDSPEARSALALAKRVALAARGTVRAYTVIDPGVQMRPVPPGASRWDMVSDGARERARQSLRAALSVIGDDGAGYPIVGTPAQELVRRSDLVDLLVLGSRSYGPLRRLLLGSTSRRVVRAAKCPVLVLPRGAHVPLERESPTLGVAREG